MKNRVFAIFFLCGAGAVMLLAADFWQKKPYTAWDATDIQRVLNDSPWAREVEILMGALRMAGGGPGDSGEMARSSSPLAGAGREGGMGGPGGAGMGGAAGPGGAPRMGARAIWVREECLNHARNRTCRDHRTLR